MVAYTISIPNSDTTIEVEYDPQAHSIDDYAVLGIADQRASFDPAGLYISAPVGKLGFKMIRLEEYLLDAAAQLHMEDMTDKSEFEEHGVWNKAQQGVK